MAVRGIRCKQKRSKEKGKGNGYCYGVHHRVLRWKSTERIKEEWDRGGSERWKVS
uniref:Uncharacterized protein n=1 Tax=Encephalitozoon cuniculi TaxID=6035 RepID=M1KAT9_ENCCN|nr:hypothetical protein ECU09_2020 [Encephalitozoon cuniculi]